MLKQRTLLGWMLLSFITFGVYGLYWIYAMSRDINQLVDDGNYTKPGLAVIFQFITLGIYYQFWIYKQGNRMKACGTRKGVPVIQGGGSYLAWIWIGLLLFGLGPLIAIYKFLRNYNNLTVVYNHSIVEKSTRITNETLGV